MLIKKAFEKIFKRFLFFCQSILKYPVYAFYGEACFVRGLHATYDPGRNAETFRYFNDFSGVFFIQIDFHTVSHIENLIHFGPVGAALLLYKFEQRGFGEQVVFYDVQILHKMQYLGLGSA